MTLFLVIFQIASPSEILSNTQLVGLKYTGKQYLFDSPKTSKKHIKKSSKNTHKARRTLTPIKEDQLNFPTPTRNNTYVKRQLILQPLQIEVQIGLGHLLGRPASQLGQNARRHIDDEAVLAVQQIQERTPDVLLASGRVLVEDVDARAILLEQIVDQHENVLDGLVLGDVRQQIEQRLGALVRLGRQVGGLRFAVERRNTLEVLVVDHLGPGGQS